MRDGAAGGIVRLQGAVPCAGRAAPRRVGGPLLIHTLLSMPRYARLLKLVLANLVS
jgi:hypothetical protein